MRSSKSFGSGHHRHHGHHFEEEEVFVSSDLPPRPPPSNGGVAASKRSKKRTGNAKRVPSPSPSLASSTTSSSQRVGLNLRSLMMKRSSSTPATCEPLLLKDPTTGRRRRSVGRFAEAIVTTSDLHQPREEERGGSVCSNSSLDSELTFGSGNHLMLRRGSSGRLLQARGRSLSPSLTMITSNSARFPVDEFDKGAFLDPNQGTTTNILIYYLL